MNVNDKFDTFGCKKGSTNYRSRLAEATTNPRMLIKLSRDGSDIVRKYVSSNLNTPPKVLSRLVGDKSKWVRYHVIQNPNTPERALRMLYNSDRVEMFEYIKRNPNCPLDILLSHKGDGK